MSGDGGGERLPLRVFQVDSAASWRGGQNQVLLTAAGMAAAGHDVSLICHAGGVLAQRGRSQGLRVEPAGFRGGDLPAGAILTLRRLLRDSPPDIVHAHDPHAISASLLARALAGSSVPVVATRRVDFRLRGALSRLKHRRCDRIVAVSRAIVDVLEADGVPAELVRLVHEGVRDRPPQPGGEAALAELGVPAGAPVVGVVAALTGHKDHETLLRAAQRVVRRRPDVHFVLAGEGELRADLERLAAELGLGSRCIFAGFRDDLDRLIPAFTIFCLSSKLEGLGTSLLDAMCFGRPSVATAAGGIPEVVEDGVTGRVVPVCDPAALGTALLELLDEEDARERMGVAGRQRFEERFSLTRMLERTLRVYAELVPCTSWRS